MTVELTMSVARGDERGGAFVDCRVPAVDGEVALDVFHRLQSGPAPDLACRSNCKAGKCGSCSVEVNGTPRLMCMTHMEMRPCGARCGPARALPRRNNPIPTSTHRAPTRRAHHLRTDGASQTAANPTSRAVTNSGGGRCRDRTDDLLVVSELLYRLS